MVDGVRGLKGRVVRHVVVEYKNILEHVTILHLHVVACHAEAIVLVKNHAMHFVVVVRICTYVYIEVHYSMWYSSIVYYTLHTYIHSYLK